MTLATFIKKKPQLLSYANNFSELSEDAAVEATLKNGDWDDVLQLIKILGVKNTAKIFRRQLRQAGNNYSERGAHYFRLYFNKYAPVRRKK